MLVLNERAAVTAPAPVVIRDSDPEHTAGGEPCRRPSAPGNDEEGDCFNDSTA